MARENYALAIFARKHEKLLNMSGQIIIHAVRHAQGYHNLGEEFFGLKDPALTPRGEQQCAERRQASFQDQSKFNLIASSPMTRTLHTAYLIFNSALETQNIFAIPEAQEISDHGCDIGSNPDVLKQKTQQNGWPVDLSLVSNGWNDKNLYGPNSPVTGACATRARTVRRILREKGIALSQDTNEDIHIALVAHGSFMHYFSNDWEDSCAGCGTGWKNCETRRYVFQNDDSDEDAWLVETDESRQARGLDRPAPSAEEQRELYEKTMVGWVEQGLPDIRYLATASIHPMQEDQPKL
jgi:broad specificity phosphatase PhoE